MVLFWLGTVPALVVIAIGMRRATGALQRRLPVISALLVIGVGVAALSGRLQASAHRHETVPASTPGRRRERHRRCAGWHRKWHRKWQRARPMSTETLASPAAPRAAPACDDVACTHCALPVPPALLEAGSRRAVLLRRLPHRLHAAARPRTRRVLPLPRAPRIPRAAHRAQLRRVRPSRLHRAARAPRGRRTVAHRALSRGHPLRVVRVAGGARATARGRRGARRTRRAALARHRGVGRGGNTALGGRPHARCARLCAAPVPRRGARRRCGVPKTAACSPASAWPARSRAT